MQSLGRIAPTRRGLMTGAALGAASLALPGQAVAKMPTGLPPGAVLFRFKLGGAECTVVSDGQLPLGNPADDFSNITKEEIARELHDNFLPADKWVLEQNILIANLGDRAVLFDTGMGIDDLFGTSPGKLMSALRGAGNRSSRH